MVHSKREVESYLMVFKGKCSLIERMGTSKESK